MTTFAINMTNGASTRYSDYAFDSFCQGPDGKYYGIKADGLYLLEGEFNGDASIGLGNIDFGSRTLKFLPAAYVQASSDDVLELVVSGGGDEYEYPARSSSDTLKTHRFDLGKGLRENYFELTLRNTNGSKFDIDNFEIPEVKSKRSIQS